MMFSARIIVILSGCEDMSGCIQRLLSIGVVNLITAETLEDAADELREALSDEGMQRYVTPAPVSSQPEPQRNRLLNRRPRSSPTAGTLKMSVLPLQGRSAEAA